MFSSREIISTLDVQLQLLKPIMCGGGCYVVSEPGRLPRPPRDGLYEKHIFQITTMRKENIPMEILRYGASGAPAWKILRGRRVLLKDIFRHALLLLQTHGLGYPVAVYH